METASARCARSRHRSAAGRVRTKRSRQHAGSERDRNHPPLHPAFHLELRHRSWHVSARLLHHEVQPARERSGFASGRAGQRASLPAGEDFARRAAHHEDAERLPDRNHRHGRHHPAARRRRAWRTHRLADGARASSGEGQSPQENFDSRFRSRHQSRHRRDGRLRGRESEIQ